MNEYFTLEEIRQILADAEDNYDLSTEDVAKLCRTAIDALQRLRDAPGAVE